MSCSYADGLSEYHDKGKLGLPETFDGPDVVETKVSQLASWVASARHVVVYTGAGISTSAGIPDFRGPKGVWTLEKKGEKPSMNVSWDDARPTLTHMAIAKLVQAEKVKFVVSQNIDGLHLRSGVGRTSIAELHGNMFVDQCDMCRRMFVRDSPAPTVGQKFVGGDCPATKSNGRNCRGKLRDFVLDWEAELPQEDLDMSDTHSMEADLSIVMGSTLQIIPAGNMPTYGKKYQPNGKLVICNLQPTKQDKKADLCIHTYVDDVMRMLMKRLGLEIPEYDPVFDPVKQVRKKIFPNGMFLDWTQDAELAGDLMKIGEKLHEEHLALKREERKRKNLLKEEEAVVKTKKMQKRAEVEALEVKEESDDDKDDVPLAMRLGMKNGKNKNGQKLLKSEVKQSSNGSANGSLKNGALQNHERPSCDAEEIEMKGKSEETEEEAFTDEHDKSEGTGDEGEEGVASEEPSVPAL